MTADAEGPRQAHGGRETSRFARGKASDSHTVEFEVPPCARRKPLAADRYTDPWAYRRRVQGQLRIGGGGNEYQGEQQRRKEQRHDESGETVDERRARPCRPDCGLSRRARR